MENLRTEAIRASKERVERQRLEQEQQRKAADEYAARSLIELIHTHLGRDVDVAQIQTAGEGEALHPVVIATVDNVRLMAAPTSSALDQGSDAQGYALFVVSHCHNCQDADVVSGEIHEIADVGDFLQQRHICPSCIENMEDEAGTVHISSFSDF